MWQASAQVHQRAIDSIGRSSSRCTALDRRTPPNAHARPLVQRSSVAATLSRCYDVDGHPVGLQGQRVKVVHIHLHGPGLP